MLRDEIITVFGGSGFIGRYLVRALCKAGWRVRVATRRPHLAIDLKVAGVVGQVQLVQANLRNPASVARAVEGAHGVINLVGVLYESGRQSFTRLHAQGAETVARAAKAAGAKRLIHVSAIGADADSPSRYARTKAAGEAAAKKAFPGATILRPSVVFGTEDQFFNRFANMARYAPALPLIGGGMTRFQPVFAGDVAAAAVNALEIPESAGKTYELGGPKVYTFKELMTFMLEVVNRRRLLVPVPFPLATVIGVKGEMFGALPFAQPFLTRDQVEQLKADNVAAPKAPGLNDLGVTPRTVEAVVPGYLARFRRYGQFHVREA
ncbi:MAG: complex I NDUFA9 subunit family protein [Maricaulaceae bacterium]|nr:complex I NDUFA9 subunit family protein [Maricaulaceae bacterium]